MTKNCFAQKRFVQRNGLLKYFPINQTRLTLAPRILSNSSSDGIRKNPHGFASRSLLQLLCRMLVITSASSCMNFNEEPMTFCD